jgi:hypothetical protein
MFPRHLGRAFICLALSNFAVAATPKPHVITFGKWSTVQYHNDSDEKPLTLKIRSLLVDARAREFTTGVIHDITDRLFVVQRAFRINDSLPADPAPRWEWQVGGWLLVDRLTGRISTLTLPEFDVSFSTPSWYRDYAAYCGVSDDGKKIYAVVAQVGRRKALLKKFLSEKEANKSENEPNKNEQPKAEMCSTPTWERSPTRVSFVSASAARQTFAIRGHGADLVADTDDEEEEAAK